jgi:hypothetical protein
MRCVLKSLSVGAVLTATVSASGFAQSASINPPRVAAIRECNALASPFLSYTWGNWQLYIYRECRAEHGQTE